MAKSRATTHRDRELGMIIRSLRKNKKFTSKDLSKELDMSYQQINKYEKGKSRLSVFVFMDICKVLKVNPRKIIKRFM